jgi:hypothetical protein
MRIEESTGQLVIESGADNPDRIWVDLITPGWGSSGYYSQEVLERDMPKIYPKGSHMYIDHPTMSEMNERPERSVKELAAVLTETAHWDDSRGSVGAYAELFPDWAEPIKAKSSAIGVSIFADGEIEESDREVEGKKGPVIHSLTDGFSVDFVTQAGRGGKIGESSERPTMRLLESAREELTQEKESRTTSGRKETQMDEAEAARLRQQLSEAQDKVRQLEGDVSTLTEARDTAVRERDEASTRAERAEDAIQLVEAGRVVREAVSGVEGLPEKARERAVGSALTESLPVDGDGKLIKETLQERGRQAAQKEIEYLTEAGAGGSGSGVTGLGGIASGSGSGSGDGGGSDAGRQSLVESLTGMGMSEDAAKIAAAGR